LPQDKYKLTAHGGTLTSPSRTYEELGFATMEITVANVAGLIAAMVFIGQSNTQIM